MGLRLKPELKGKLIELLRAKANCFSWSRVDMKGIPPEVMSHKLNMDHYHLLVK